MENMEYLFLRYSVLQEEVKESATIFIISFKLKTDEKKEMVESYEFRSINIEEGTTGITKEDILQAIKEMEGLAYSI